MYLSIIIPAYNEEKRLPKTLAEIDRYLTSQRFKESINQFRVNQRLDQRESASTEYEIIVVSDGSKDKTAEVVRKLQNQIRNLRLIDNKENHGKGYVVRQGMLAAIGEYRLFTDADNSTSIDQVEKMWPEFSASAEGYGGPADSVSEAEATSAKEAASREGGPPPWRSGLRHREGGEKGFDIIIGSRDIKGAILDPPQSFFRRLVGEGFKIFRKIIIGLWGLEDTQCGFKGFTKKVVEDVFPRCKIDRFAFDPEILVIAKKLGYKIKEIPVYWKNDPESKVKFKSMIKMAIDLIKIKWNLITKKYAP